MTYSFAFELIYNLIAGVCMFCVFSKKIDTSNEFKLIGLGLIIIGAFVSIKHQIHIIFSAGVLVYLVGEIFNSYFRRKT
jgi:hypothetical protein